MAQLDTKGTINRDTPESGNGATPPRASILVGTEAILHRVRSAASVVFLDFDQELLAPHFRAGERAMALLCRAARVVGGRGARAAPRGSTAGRSPDGVRTPGRLVVQTRLPGNEVLQAALRADPGRLAEADARTRSELRLPPAVAMALLSGDSAGEYAREVRMASDAVPGLSVMGASDGSWMVKAPDHRTLCDTLGSVARPAGRLRVEVDPRRL